MTQKLSWSLVTRHPYHTFWWEGIDGVESARASAARGDLQQRRGARARSSPRNRISSKKRCPDRCLMLFGIGDGGGGPGEEHLERLARETRPRRAVPGGAGAGDGVFSTISPRTARAIRPGRASSTSNATRGPTPPRAASSASTASSNSRLRELELIGVASPRHLSASPYPRAALERIWKEAAALSVPRHPAGFLDHPRL